MKRKNCLFENNYNSFFTKIDTNGRDEFLIKSSISKLIEKARFTNTRITLCKLKILSYDFLDDEYELGYKQKQTKKTYQEP